MILFIQLFLAHIIGDFVLQSDAWAKSKREKKLKSVHFYFHILIHGLLIMLVVWDLNFWPQALVIMGLHFLIDVARMYIPARKNEITLFIIDQLLHLIVLAGVVVWYKDLTFSFEILSEPVFLIYVTGITFITLPSSMIVKVFVAKKYTETETQEDDSLLKAGNYIGILERIFILIFVLLGRWEGIGFLIAAKSVFWISNTKGVSDRKLTEYFLIGTLLSFILAMFAGITMQWLINNYQI